ncbi:hypothetical protein CHUAL_009541 [Chamberlinius hualienensis]
MVCKLNVTDYVAMAQTNPKRHEADNGRVAMLSFYGNRVTVVMETSVEAASLDASTAFFTCHSFFFTSTIFASYSDYLTDNQPEEEEKSNKQLFGIVSPPQ